MSNYKNYLILISLSMLILMLAPISFAGDLNENATNVFDVNDVSSNTVQEDILTSDNECCFIVYENDIEIEEGEDVNITGEVLLFDNNVYSDSLNIQYSYEDADGNSHVNRIPYHYDPPDVYDYNFDPFSFTIKNLTYRQAPYIITISPVEDELYDEYLVYGDELKPLNVTVKVTSNEDPAPVIPTTETFNIKGQIYVSDSEGNDSFDGNESTPFKTIQRALNENRALGGDYEIIVKAGEYYLQNPYDISNNVRITGRGKVTISNEGQSYLFFTTGTIIAEFVNLTITRGINAAISGSSTMGGSGNAGKVLNIYNCTFVDNYGAYVGVIITYSKTTILNSTFINNQAEGTTSEWQGLISSRDGSLTINYCNFIDNTVRDGKPLIEAANKANANYNFWGTNDGPKSTDLAGNIAVKTWLAIMPTINATEVVTGESYNVMVGYKYTNGSGKFKDLNISLPKVDVDVGAKLGNLTPSTVTISDDVNVSYVSDFRGNEKVSVYLNGAEISNVEFLVKAAIADRIYVSATDGNDDDVGTKEYPLKTIAAAILKNKELGGEKTIIILPGEYGEHDLEITENVSILAENESTVTINALNNGRIFIVDANVNITNVTFKNALIDNSDKYFGCGGAILHNSGNLSILNCIFENNSALNGGAIATHAQNGDTLTIADSEFKSNALSESSGDFKGAAIYSQSNMIVDNCEFSLNVAKYGAVYATESANITNSKFEENKAHNGAAIFISGENKANFNIIGNEFSFNEANEGAIYVGSSNLTLIENNTFNENVIGIYLHGNQLNTIIQNNNFTNSSIYLKSASAHMKSNSLSPDSKAQIIVDGGSISNAILTYLKNKTVMAQNGTIQLNATLSDDEGNLITGGEITFTSEGVDIGKATVVDGFASITHYFDTGNYVISGNYSSANQTTVKDGLLRVNVDHFWFIGDVGYETLAEAVNASEIGDVIKGIPGEYYVDQIQVGHRTRPDEPWVINKQFTLTSLSDEPITLKALGENIFNIDYYSNLTFKNIIFTGARNPDGWGGAIYSMGHNTIDVDNCTFIDNYAYSGAAIHTWGGLTINNTLFIDNIASVYGGAVFKDSDGDLVIENTKFINNTAYTYAGALYTMGYSDISQLIRNVVFDGNDATCAGAFFTAGKDVTVIDCNFTNNRAIDKNSGYEPCGGAVYVHMGATNFTNVNFINNYAEGTGGALQLDNSLSSVVNSTGRHQTIYWAILNNCLVENNTATGDGGAFYTGEFNTYVNVTNSIIRNNTARNAALFVSLYSFYTLDNVVIENNRNTAGDSLVYTYGMFSIPESYYANSSITNCVFKNNDALEVFKPTNEYAVVNVSDCIFEECGAILTSINAKANLTRNVEINPKANYSVTNKGNLSLDKNSFINPIFTSGIIDTPTTLVIMDNKTVIGEIDENMTLYAQIYDDNGNVVVGPNVVFVINDTIVASKLENTTYVASYAPKQHLEIVNAVTGDLGLLNLTIKTATIKGVATPVILADDVEFNMTGKLNATLVDKNNASIEKANITITVNNVEYDRITDQNGEVNVDLKLLAGIYEALIEFKGSEDFAPVSKTVNVTVNKLSSFVNSEIGEAKVGEKIPVTVTVPNDATGNVTVNVGGKNYTFAVKNGKANGNIANLTLGEYNVTITYNGDYKYGESSETTSINVVKCDSFILISVDDVMVGEKAIVNLIVPHDATGNIVVSVDRDYLVEVVNGHATVEISNLEIGSYNVEATYYGDMKYLDSSNQTTFNVLKDAIVKQDSFIRVSVDDIVVGEKAIVNIVVPDNATGSVVVSVDRDYLVDIDNGRATVEISNLEIGSYNVEATYYGDMKYRGSSNKTTFNVLDEADTRKDSFVWVSVEDIVVGEKAIVNIVVPDDATGSIVVSVDRDYLVDIDNGHASVAISNLEVGSYDVEAAYYGDMKYRGSSNKTAFNVLKNESPVKSDSFIIITVDDIVAGKKAIINLAVPDDATGNITVHVDKDYSVAITDGKAVVEISNLEVGKYNVEAIYHGDLKYNDSSNKTTFNVLNPPTRKAKIEITLIDNGGNLGFVLEDVDGVGIAHEAVIYSINGVNNTVITNSKGEFNILAKYDAKMVLFFKGNAEFLPVNSTIVLKNSAPTPKAKVASQFNISGGVITLKGYAVDTKAGEEGIYYATELLDDKGNPVKGAKIQFAVNDKIYKRTTKENGGFTPYKLNMNRAGRYTMAFHFSGDDSYEAAFASVCVDLDKKPIKIKASNKSFKASVKTKKYTVTLSTIVGSSHDGKVHFSPKTVKLKVNGKTYSGKTNSKGKVTFKINNLSKKGKYVTAISVKGDGTYDDASKTVKLTIK